MTHTHDTLMALCDDYADAAVNFIASGESRNPARAALSAAIAEVLAERDNTLEILKRIEPKVDALIAELARLKAQLGEWQGLAGIQGDMIKTIASGAAQKENT